MKRLSPFFLVVVFLVGCGEPEPKTPSLSPKLFRECPAAMSGHGSMGACAPKQKLGLTAPHAVSGTTYPDRSNNDPTYNMAAIRRAGHPGIVLKVNQGTGFIDRTFLGMASAARRARLVVGGYDFDQDYTVAETYTFVARLHAAGLYRVTPSTFPPTLDVEFGNANRAGLEHQLAVLFRAFGRADIYTGGWYWLPHFGCWWPRGVPAWLSGYPTASIFCGLPAGLFTQHQYTDRGFDGVSNVDMTVWRGSASSFRAFAHIAKPKPKPRPRPKPHPKPKPTPKRCGKLCQLRHRRGHLRAVLTAQHCRVKHPNRHCRGVLRTGANVNRQIRALEAAARRTH